MKWGVPLPGHYLGSLSLVKCRLQGKVEGCSGLRERGVLLGKEEFLNQGCHKQAG